MNKFVNLSKCSNFFDAVIETFRTYHSENESMVRVLERADRWLSDRECFDGCKCEGCLLHNDVKRTLKFITSIPQDDE